MIKRYPNEHPSAIRAGDVITDKGFGRTFVADSPAHWDETIEAYVIKANMQWLELSRSIDIECEEVKEDQYI